MHAALVWLFDCSELDWVIHNIIYSPAICQYIIGLLPHETAAAATFLHPITHQNISILSRFHLLIIESEQDLLMQFQTPTGINRA